MAASPLSSLPCLLAFAACSAAPPARLAPTPLGAPGAAVRLEAVRADADRSRAPAGASSPFVHDASIRALYGDAGAATPTVDPAVEAGAASPSGVSTASATVAIPETYAWRREREPFVPAATIFGAGLGAALSACGSRGEGALLGAGIGLLFDLQRAAR